MNADAPDRTIALYLSKWKILQGLSLSRLLVPTPLVLVNGRGIVSHPPGFLFFKWRMEITWPEIAALQVQEVISQPPPPPKLFRLLKISFPSTHRYLAIIPTDPEAYLERHKLTRVRTLVRIFPLWLLIETMKTPMVIVDSHIAPVSVDDLLARIRTRFQAELEANGIEIREPQRTDRSQLPQSDLKRSPEELSIDREAFRQWLAQQEGPLVGTGRAKGSLRELLGAMMATDPLDSPPGRDDTPLARYLAGVLGYRVHIAVPCVFLPRSADQSMMRLPAWARAFDEQVQPTPEKTVTKEEALAALEQVSYHVRASTCSKRSIVRRAAQATRG
ncbi:MAG: hypothetical protein ACREP9_04495 [Candidatus Dormibacteraceae bacterium]